MIFLKEDGVTPRVNTTDDVKLEKQNAKGKVFWTR